MKKKPFSTYNQQAYRKNILLPHLLRLANECASEALSLGKDGGLDEVIAVTYLKGAYGHLPIADYQAMSGSFDIYGNC